MIDEKLLIETMQWKMREAGTSDWNRCLDEVERFIREFPQVGGWIPASERLPSKEECEKYRRKFLVTVNAADPTTMEMKYVHTTVRGKEVERWEWKDSISPWDVKAWQPLPEPFKESDK